VLKVRPDGRVCPADRESVNSSGGETPSIVSLFKTFRTGVNPTDESATLPMSFSAFMAAGGKSMITVAVAISQLNSLTVSQT